MFINQLVLLNSCHTGSLVVWVVSARMTHGSVADDAVSSKSNLTSCEVIFSPCNTGQFLMMLFQLFYQCMLVLYDWCSFFCCFLFLKAWMSCLISNLVAPLLDGLNNLLDNGSLGNLSHWGKSISTGFWESKTGMSDSNGSGISSMGKSNGGSSNIGSWGNSVGSIWVRGSKTSMTGIASIAQVVGISQ